MNVVAGICGKMVYWRQHSIGQGVGLCMQSMVSLQAVSKIYTIGSNKLAALSRVSLDIMPGEVVCIVGPSGSGKSTLLNLMAGLEKPSRGSIRVAGIQIEKLSENALVKYRLENVGFVFQSFNLFTTHTALDNVAMPLVYKGVPRAIRRKRALKLLKAVGLQTHIRHKPMQMSGGQQQRVGIARALVANPKIIFADEPTGNLDSRTSHEIMHLVYDMVKSNGQTLIMVTHDPNIARYAERIIHLLDGKIRKIETNSRPAALDPLPPPQDDEPDFDMIVQAPAAQI